MSYAWPILRDGTFAPEVGNWQRFLASVGFPLTVDERFGPLTAAATSSFQERSSLGRTGEVDVATRGVGVAQGFIPFLPARHFNQQVKPRAISLIVVHTMEVPHESYGMALSVGRWFASPLSSVASAHYGVDRDATIQYVRDQDVAWHVQSNALDSGNTRSIGVEHAAHASESAADWADEASSAMLLRSARLVASLMKRYGVPLVRLAPDDVAAGQPGICGHVDVTNAYHVAGGHTDPGASFPWDYYLTLVRDALPST